MPVAAPILYIVTMHEGLDGVRLSKPGHWGGRWYPDDEAAGAAAEKDAGRHPFTVKHETLRRRRVQA